MGTTSSFLDSLLATAKAVAPLIHPAAPGMIALGERVVDLIDKSKDVFDGNVPAPLQAERDALQARVTAHVTDTAKRLRGEAQ